MATVFEYLILSTRDLLGDIALDEWSADVLATSMRLALERYSMVYERVEVGIAQVDGSGLFGLKLKNWNGQDEISELAYLHWPAAASLAAVSGDNRIRRWWHYRSGGASEDYIQFDLAVEGAALPADGDYILVHAISEHRIEGLAPPNKLEATTTTAPRGHWHILVLGAAAYALRSRESGLSVQAGAEPGFVDAYHVGVLAGLAERYMAEFEAALAALPALRPIRPPWAVRR